MNRKPRIPSYRLHRPSGRAVVTLSGKDHYLGEHNSPESHAEYQRVVAEWLARSQTSLTKGLTGDLSIAEVVVAYMKHAATYYKDADGNATPQVDAIKHALRPVSALYARTAAKDFGPLSLKAVREKMIAGGLARGVINQRINIIKRMFKWASSDELIPASCFHGLSCVEGLRRARSNAKETEPIRPVSDAQVDAILPFLTPTVKTMVQVQLATGMRTGELTLMRGKDIDRSESVWKYKPQKHKTQHHGHVREIPLGPRAQELLKPFLTDDAEAFLFSPAKAKEEWYAARRKARKTKVQPSQGSRRRRAPKRAPGDHYNHHTYYRAIQYAITKARKNGVEVVSWHPHQLRHSTATRIRKEKGLDAARAVLGHKSLAITETYAEIDSALAGRVAAEMG